jgi:hypothetical protein
MTTLLQQAVLDAARAWLTDRNPSDIMEKALAVAICRAWPGEMAGKEDCKCGEADTCDECPTRAEAEAVVARWERDVAACPL